MDMAFHVLIYGQTFDLVLRDTNANPSRAFIHVIICMYVCMYVGKRRLSVAGRTGRCVSMLLTPSSHTIRSSTSTSSSLWILWHNFQFRHPSRDDDDDDDGNQEERDGWIRINGRKKWQVVPKLEYDKSQNDTMCPLRRLWWWWYCCWSSSRWWWWCWCCWWTNVARHVDVCHWKLLCNRIENKVMDLYIYIADAPSENFYPSVTSRSVCRSVQLSGCPSAARLSLCPFVCLTFLMEEATSRDTIHNHYYHHYHHHPLPGRRFAHQILKDQPKSKSLKFTSTIRWRATEMCHGTLFPHQMCHVKCVRNGYTRRRRRRID